MLNKYTAVFRLEHHSLAGLLDMSESNPYAELLGTPAASATAQRREGEGSDAESHEAQPPPKKRKIAEAVDTGHHLGETYESQIEMKDSHEDEASFSVRVKRSSEEPSMEQLSKSAGGSNVNVSDAIEKIKSHISNPK